MEEFFEVIWKIFGVAVFVGAMFFFVIGTVPSTVGGSGGEGGIIVVAVIAFFILFIYLVYKRLKENYPVGNEVLI